VRPGSPYLRRTTSRKPRGNRKNRRSQRFEFTSGLGSQGRNSGGSWKKLILSRAFIKSPARFARGRDASLRGAEGGPSDCFAFLMLAGVSRSGLSRHYPSTAPRAIIRPPKSISRGRLAFRDKKGILGAPFGSVRLAIPRILWGEEAAAEAPFADCDCLDLWSAAGKEFFRGVAGKFAPVTRRSQQHCE
jgi:hypothetical protein